MRKNSVVEINKNKKIENPEMWQIVTHGGKGKNKRKYPCDIIIEKKDDKKWTWRRILSDYTLSGYETGESDFYESNNRYNRVIDSDYEKVKICYVIPMKKINVDLNDSNFYPNSTIF